MLVMLFLRRHPVCSTVDIGWPPLSFILEFLSLRHSLPWIRYCWSCDLAGFQMWPRFALSLVTPVIQRNCITTLNLSHCVIVSWKPKHNAERSISKITWWDNDGYNHSFLNLNRGNSASAGIALNSVDAPRP